ncbi:alpha/beta hydrolase [Clostridium sp. YIM B02505]|uniref:Alpha/beta hydrolase n=1 Tax=Clostridium yunnanense TaxID=2800325 RepID=A0ABS1ENB7_9CLOT|nr:alpha/beta hydrolase [Clostridium yunnanense]MBK1810824.1 alpha/beta hydrolase [Clostridium yunnanense]
MDGNITRKTVNNHGIEIEYYVSNEVNDKSTLIISMGIWEPASRALPLIARLLGRHCIALSYRGRGGSSTPKTGFDWSNHISDIATVIENEPINKPVFLGFSKGVSYMLGYLAANLELANGIIIIDYPAIHSKLEKGAAKFWANMIYNGVKLDNYITTYALEGIENESTYKEFYDDLRMMKCPVWIFRGTDSNADIPSNLMRDDILKYKESVKELEIVDFNYSGHMILDEELGKAAKHITDILNKIDHI